MGRLIDADKLRKQMSEDYAQNVSKISNPAVRAIVEKAVETFDGYVVSAETVKAIPEEWINDHVAWLESMDADVAGSDARAIRVMLTKWKMEQENAGGCSADACIIKFN